MARSDSNVPFYNTFFGSTPEDPPFMYGDRMGISSLKSLNYVAGSAGWKIDQGGTAEFNNVTIRGTLQSSNFVAGSAGWRLLDTGAAELSQVTIRGSSVLAGATITGNLVMSGSGKIMTAATGRRLEIATATTSRATIYTGDAAEQAPAFLDFAAAGDVINTEIRSPQAQGVYARLLLGSNRLVANSRIEGYANNVTFTSNGFSAVADSIHIQGTTEGVELWGGGTTNILECWDQTGPALRFSVARTTGRLTVNGGILVNSDWVRVKGVNGIHFEDYGGGWFMQDTTWIRAYADKAIFTAGEMRAHNSISTPASQGSTGLYLWDRSDTNHRVFYDAPANGPRMTGWGSSAVGGVQHDAMLEAGRGSAVTRHVNLGSSVWRASNALIHNNMSDPRFKLNKKPLPAQAQRVKDIAPIEFQWDEKHDIDGRMHFGFSADQLPEQATAVSFLINEETGEPEDCLMVDPMGVLAIAWQALRDTIGQVERAEARITAQEQKLTANETRLATLERGRAAPA